MNDQLKPSNDEIIRYILAYIDLFDGNGLTITDKDWIERELERIAFDSGFDVLRSMFAPRLYNSIDEYVDNQE